MGEEDAGKRSMSIPPFEKGGQIRVNPPNRAALPNPPILPNHAGP